jgi:4-hydroxybenzoate polyprenyltransferase
VTFAEYDQAARFPELSSPAGVSADCREQGTASAGLPTKGPFQTVHAYLVISRSIVALPNTVPFLLGALAAGVGWRYASASVVWALLFYSYSCKVNDLADYSTDRLNTGRTRSPMISGLVSLERVAFWAAMELMLLTAVLVASPVTGIAKVCLLGLLVLTTWGNAFQKTSRVVHPAVMDHLFGLTMAAPMLIVCAGFGGSLTADFSLLAASFFFQMIVLNSYSGNLKDLDHDLAVGAQTVAIRFGVRRVHDQEWYFPTRYRAFLLYAQIASCAALCAGLMVSEDAWNLVGVFAAFLAGAATIALAHRIGPRGRVAKVELPAGQSDALTRFMSRPPHLLLNAVGFLLAAAAISRYWLLPIVVGVSLATPKAALRIVKWRSVHA